MRKRILLHGSSYKIQTKTSTHPNNHCSTTTLRHSNHQQDSLIPIHYQINSYIMPAHTPPPLYSDSTTDQLIDNGNLNEYDVLQNYTHTHGNYLLTDSLFKLFETSHINNQTLISIIRECNFVTSPQNLHIIRCLQLLQQYNQEQTQEYYQQIITLQLTQRLYRHHNLNQQDSPSPITILSPPFPLSPSPSFSPPIASTSNVIIPTRRSRQQRKCYKCHQPFHNRIHCPSYRCQHYRKTRPGHLTRDCLSQSIRLRLSRRL